MANSRIILKIFTAVAVLLIVVGVGVFMKVRSMIDRSAARSSAAVSLLEDATWLGPALEAKAGTSWLQSARMLKISRGSAELITQQDGVARRYTTAGNGAILRRGGAFLVAAEPFDLGALEWGLVPQMVAEARQRSGSDIGRLVVGRDEEGLLLWRLVPKGEAMDVYFMADGTYVPDPDDP